MMRSQQRSKYSSYSDKLERANHAAIARILSKNCNLNFDLNPLPFDYALI